LTERLRADHHHVVTAADAAGALRQIAASAPDLVLVDQRLPDGAVTGLLDQIRAVDADIGVVLLTAAGDQARAVEAMKQGAAHYLLRPLELDEVSLVMARELERRRLRRETRILRQRLDERYRFPGVMGEAPAMQRLFKAMAQVAEGSRALLITGEAGSGKTLIAVAIHERSRRGPLVRLDADGGLDARSPGARGGSLFAEEIADLSPVGQLKLLHLLEQQDATTDADRAGGAVCVLAATRCNLDVEVARGRFRQDLLQRLSEVHVHVPALRERPSDVPALAMHFLERFAAGRDRPVAGFDREALARLSAHPWPGNVSELEEVVGRAVMAAQGSRVTAAELPPDLRLSQAKDGVQIPGWTMDQLERYAILETLKAAGGSTSRAARILGISVRNVQYKLRAYRAGAPATDLRAQHASSEKVA
jgi:two-component system NtrC family response regulator/two-component system response regulator HydG